MLYSRISSQRISNNDFLLKFSQYSPLTSSDRKKSFLLLYIFLNLLLLLPVTHQNASTFEWKTRGGILVESRFPFLQIVRAYVLLKHFDRIIWYIGKRKSDGQDFVRQRISHTSRLVKVQGLWISWSVTQPRQVASGCYGKHTAKDLAPRCETRLEVCLRKQTRGRSLCFCLKFLTCRRITPWSDNAP